ncbi:MAG: hypothetical protein KME07_01030 [Pegethrix bostrychoides GSE-TBD4-15B]|jgi:hypothetical protein|uniref:Uncharacterized protein n=1 Tax=Pegethrix bostrychoides GSE-TBD4-15B TaxID=2839662 RepID=A0A951U2W3_9CYAN|nr:hypothetical protein [Pegethrix bostrychoides GSE-TBD4-15B]
MKSHASGYSNPQYFAAPPRTGHGARVAFLALFPVALFRVKTVNLVELPTAFVDKAKPASHYKRLQRFLANFELDYIPLAKLVVALMDIPQP